MRTRIVLATLACLLALPATATADPGEVTAADMRAADGCFTWTRTLSQGTSGSDVTQLQIRVAGWVASGENLVVDGAYGAATTNAVRRFQSGYGLTADGIAGPQTFNKIYELQDDDCTPIHFSHAEFDDNCGANNYEGGKVSAATVRENVRRIMWQLEALRHKLGDRALVVTSSFRSVSCNSSVGGSSTSLHMWGQAADLGLSSAPTQCQMFSAAKSAGFEEILGPGYPDHNDHVHVGNKSGQFWSAPNC
ncbi:M15 family metallopeptidase [Actinophytocola sp.]|uniref:M15 family metallopeptidase n=1 Tax=Actinophytocola sp. TaxID=1872138 RepID=UPI002ED615F8